MRYMIIVKASAESEAGVMPRPEDFARMAAYHEELAEAGVLVDASGLHPTSNGWRIRFHDDERTVVDGPFTEAKELMAGYTIIRVSSRAEAMDWAMRFPSPGPGGGEGEIEVRQMFELEDFEQTPDIERFRKLGVSGAERSA